MSFRKNSKGEGVISNPKIYIADFCHYKRFFGHEFRKKTAIWFSENEAGPKAVWNFSENSSLLVGPPVPHRLSYIQYIFWLPKVQALIKKTTICISSFILNSVSFVLQVCSIEFSFSELIEFCSIFTHFLRMEKSADEYTGQFIVLRTVYTTRVTLCTTPGIKTSAVTNQPLPGLFVWIEKLIKAHFSFFLF